MPGGRLLKRAGQPAAEINDRHRRPQCRRHITRLTTFLPFQHTGTCNNSCCSGVSFTRPLMVRRPSYPFALKFMGSSKESFFASVTNRVISLYDYCTKGVWSDPRNNWRTRTVKTLNLTLSAFFDSSLQNKSMALTYSTVLAIVPALALLVAIGRGFGLQDVMQSQLYQFFPSQVNAIHTVLRFVDSYLNSATQGVFVGAGIVLLLWTVVSLLGSIEETFNSIWGITRQRTFFQKMTDYIAICLLIPILIICSSGVSIFMSSLIQDNLELAFLSPFLNVVLEFAPLVLCWVAFTLSYLLIPNTKVDFKYAAIAGAFAAISFQILQMLFVNGTIYVSKYNAIYGSFAFLPLFLIWLQLSWLVLLTGCMLSFSMQNVFTFNLMGDESSISNIGWHEIALIVMAVIVQRFEKGLKPYSEQEIAVQYILPIRLVMKVVAKMKAAGLVLAVAVQEEGNKGLVPASDSHNLTVAEFLKRYDADGAREWIKEDALLYKEMSAQITPLREKAYSAFSDLLISQITLPSGTTTTKR